MNARRSPRANRHAVVIRIFDDWRVRKVARLGAVAALTFGVTLCFLVVWPWAGGDRPDVASTPDTPLAQAPAADIHVRSPEPTPSSDAERPPSATDRVARSSQGGDEEFTAEQISQLVAADPEFGRAIAAMLDDPDPEVRRHAAEIFNAYLNASDTPAGGMPRQPN